MVRSTLRQAARIALALVLFPLTLAGCGQSGAPDSEAASETAFRREIDQPLFAVWEGLDIGRDLLTPVSSEYSSPFTFTGELQSVVYDLDRAGWKD